MRDFQQSTVYATEHLLGELFDRTVESDNPVIQVEGVTVTLPPEAKFASIESIQRYCDRVCDMVEVSGVHVRATRSDAKSAHYEPRGAVIAIPDGRKRWALRELVVLHELAHHLTPSGVASHGGEFVSNFIDLIGRVMGPHAQLAARIVFDTNGVRVGTKSTLS